MALLKHVPERQTEFVMVLLTKYEMKLTFAMWLQRPELVLRQKVVQRWVASMKLQFAQKLSDSLV
jgi:hypothetical protein